MRLVAVFVSALALFVTSANAQVQPYWVPTMAGGEPGTPMSDPIEACRVSHQSYSFNPRQIDMFSPSYNSSGELVAFTCRKWVTQGYWGTTGRSQIACPAGTKRSDDGATCTSELENAGCPKGSNPISYASGAKNERQTDFAHSNGRLYFERNYSSYDTSATALGRGWASNFHPQISGAIGSSGGGRLNVRTNDGEVLRFRRSRSVWYQAAQTAGGWSGTSGTNRKDNPGYAIIEDSLTQVRIQFPNRMEWVIKFPPSGASGPWDTLYLDEIRYPDGYTITLANSATNRPTAATDSFGNAITFQYGPSGLLTSATAPDGTVYAYEYSQLLDTTAIGSDFAGWKSFVGLTSVVYPDGTPAVSTDNPKTTYHYEYTSMPLLLTGITDERNVRIKTVEYAADTGLTNRIRATVSKGPGDKLKETALRTAGGFEVTNALGKKTIYGLSSIGGTKLLTTVNGVATSNCAASNSSMAYSAQGHLTSLTREEGQVVQRSVDAVTGLPSSETAGFGTPQAITTSYLWNTTWRKPTSIVRPGLSTAITYTTGGDPQTITLTDTTTQTVPYSTANQQRVYTFVWGANGLLTSRDGPLPGTADQISYTYDALGNLATITDEIGLVTTINQVDAMGRPLQITEASGRVSTFSYTPRGWLDEIIVNPGGSQRLTSFTYDETGNLTRIDAPGSRWTEYEYDNAGWLIEARSSAGGKIAYQHDLLGNVTTAEFQTTGGASQADFAYTYDELGRLRSLLGGASDSMLLAYDRSNRLTSETDGLGRTWLTAFDPLDRVISVTDPETHVEEQTWSTAGHVNAFEDGRSLVTSFVRNGFGEVIREVSPDRGTTDYWYDDAGRLTKVLTAAGRDTRYTYDDAGRLLTRTFPNEPALNVSFSYDSVSGGNPGIGKLTGISGNVSGRSYTYNLFGEMTGESWSIDAQTYNVGYAYSTSGDLEKITYPSGRTAEYVFDSAGRTTSIGTRPAAMGTLQSVVASATYDPFGPLSGYVFGNGVTASIDNDASYRTSRIHLTNSGGSVLDKTYTYDANSRVTGIADAVTPSASAAYTYHLDGRLRRATGAWGEVEWTYDAVGNRVLEEQFSGGSFLSSASYNYPGGSNKLSDTVSDLSAPLSTFTHTPDGNIASETAGSTATAYTYSEASRLAAITRNSTLEAEFAYDAFEHRVRRSTTSGVSHFVFLPDGRLIGEYDGATGAVIQEYVWMDDRLVGQVDGAGTLHYIQTGPLGQPLIVTDAGGSVAWRGELSPFGELVTSTGAGPEPDARFLGQWDEAGSGLYQNWHRTYDASLGRYLEADPLGLAGGQSLYGYVGQDPLNGTDNEGRLGRGMLGGIFYGLATTLATATANSLYDQVWCRRQRPDLGEASEAGFGAAASDPTIFLPGPKIPGLRFGGGKGFGGGDGMGFGGGGGKGFGGGGGGGFGGGKGDVLPTPLVGSQKLQNIINNLYKGTTNPNRVGTGTTADAIRNERLTGLPTGGKSHLQKGTESVRALENWLSANPNAPYRERLIAQSLRDDLIQALGTGP